MDFKTSNEVIIAADIHATKLVGKDNMVLWKLARNSFMAGYLDAMQDRLNIIDKEYQIETDKIKP